MKRVLIVDDHRIVRMGAKHSLKGSAEFTIAGEASNGAELLRLFGDGGEWDVVILDLRLPDADGLDLLKELKDRAPDVPVLVFSMNDEQVWGRRVIRAGASGFLNKGSEADRLLTALETITNGKLYLSPALQKELEGEAGDVPRPAHAKLSDRELQVLTLLAGGWSLTAIADSLVLSVKTVGTYRTRVCHKLGLQSTADLIRYAIEHDLAP